MTKFYYRAVFARRAHSVSQLGEFNVRNRRQRPFIEYSVYNCLSPILEKRNIQIKQFDHEVRCQVIATGGLYATSLQIEESEFASFSRRRNTPFLTESRPF